MAVAREMAAWGKCAVRTGAIPSTGADLQTAVGVEPQFRTLPEALFREQYQ